MQSETQSESEDEAGMLENFPSSYHMKGKWRDSTPLTNFHEHQTETESEVDSDIEADMLRAAITSSTKTLTSHSISGAGLSTTVRQVQEGDLFTSGCPIGGTRNAFLTAHLC